jgi:hypothetical protein
LQYAVPTPDFPLRDPLQPVLGGGYDAFVSKLDPTGSTLIFSTYLGGSSTYVVGWTGSVDFPLMNPLQPVYGGGGADAFIAQLDPSGTRLVYSTYLGGSGEDDAFFRPAVEADGRIYLTGATESPDFPLVNPLQSQLRGVRDAFVARIAPAGRAGILDLPGRQRPRDRPRHRVDPARSIFVTGLTGRRTSRWRMRCSRYTPAAAMRS